MTITYTDIPEDMVGMESMLPADMTVQFLGTKTRINQVSAFSTVNVVHDNATETGFVLMDMMGQKILTRTDGDTEPPADEAVEVKKTAETKMIAGYSCTKYIVTSADGAVLNIWTTDALPVQENMNGVTTQAPGFPMEYSTVKAGMTMNMIVTVVKEETLSPSLFAEPTDTTGYTVLSAEEMKNMGKQ